MDFSLLHALNRFLVRHDGIEDPVVAYVALSQVVFVALVAAALLGGGANQLLRRRAGVVALVATPVALLVAQLLSRLVDRPRPFVDHANAVTVFTSHSPDPGFPSDHATASFAIATALVLYDRRWGIPALALAALLAVGRVGIGVHYPTDVMGGAVLGAAVAAGVWRLGRGRLERLADTAGHLRLAAIQRLRATAP